MGRHTKPEAGYAKPPRRPTVPALAARIVLLCVLAAAWASPAPATLYYIKPDGTGAFPTIQAAIDAAVDGDVIALADGTFTGEGNRDLTFQGKAITVRSYNGDPEVCTIDCEHVARGVSFYMGEGSGSRLESITITHGELSTGAAMGASGSSPIISNVIFRNNHATEGGAIYT